MIDRIVQEVREARAEVAADFGNDRARFWAWARAHAAAEKKAKHRLPIRTDKSMLEATGESSKPLVTRKRRVRPARVAA